jgi:hypothetical protein
MMLKAVWVKPKLQLSNQDVGNSKEKVQAANGSIHLVS